MKKRTQEAAPPLPEISLPVFRELWVDDYELFPGRTKEGLHHPFLPGVTVVTGVNGLGKTTLLNVMLRLLVGPSNPQKVNPFEVGAKSHELIPWRQARRFFSSRVSDGAVDAKARATVDIGSHTLTIERSLKDLKVSFLEFDGMELEPTELEYRRVALLASNTADEYDFDFLVRYLVFFLEQRVPLFWNDRGQVETFRILLCDAALADRLREVEDEIRDKDSLFRNFRWQANGRSDALKEAKAALGQVSGLSAKVAALSETLRALREKDDSLVQGIAALGDERSDLRTQLLLRKIELEEAQRANEALQQSFLSSVFPDTDESARYIFSTLLSGRGCAVCGNRTDRGMKRLQHLLSHGDCVACESPRQDQEQVPNKRAPAQAELKKVAADVVRLQKSISGLEGRNDETEKQLRELFIEHASVKQQRAECALELQSANAKLPGTPEELKSLEIQVAIETEELAARKAALEKLYAEYKGLLAQVDARVTAISKRVQQHFSEYAQAFMSERCYLGQSSYKAKLGESREFTYPCFKVYMTSAVSPDQETEREEVEDVSESQREFIDLAFRMALLAAATSNGSRSMLVIETPEASLDAYFVEQAGTMLKNFARGDQPDGNVVIVSSNVATQNMISALLGLTGAKRHWPSATAVRKRVINLLKEGAPNAALRQRRQLYERLLTEATKGLLGDRRG